MIISTSSHNVQLTDDICEHVESSMRNAFEHLTDRVVSVNARLEAAHSARERRNVTAIVRVDLDDHRTVVTEIDDDNLYKAIRRGAAHSAASI